MENPTTIAIDLSKGVFEVAVEREGRTCQRRRLNRRQLAAFLSECVGPELELRPVLALRYQRFAFSFPLDAHTSAHSSAVR